MANRSLGELGKKIEALGNVAQRPMFGYQCYTVNGKFFAGFGNDNAKLIIRLSKVSQQDALGDKRLKIKPFSHGASNGWVEVNMANASNTMAAYDWIRKGYEYALDLSKKTQL
jgi:predicted DNA-binding protein (MmcQ/YjbR family)